jgi:16S rRNA (cytosine1402-N4)-methyltransferase
MLKEALEYLDLRPGKTIVDATIGMAGHSINIAERIMPGGRLIGIDRDESSLELARQKLSGFGNTCELVYGNYCDIDRILAGLNIEKVDGILFDLGISSYQLDDPQRGFSFKADGPLDMRLDKNSYICAYDLINNVNEDEISHLLWVFGEERWHNRIARYLVKERQRHPISTTQELSEIVQRAVPHKYKYYRIHPATRTFQAVRIAVNRELEALDQAISKAAQLLAESGRICVIAFHSLEDRSVKLSFRKLASIGLLEVLTPKPLTPGVEEVRLNPSSRSAKFRAARKR